MVVALLLVAIAPYRATPRFAVDSDNNAASVTTSAASARTRWSAIQDVLREARGVIDASLVRGLAAVERRLPAPAGAFPLVAWLVASAVLALVAIRVHAGFRRARRRWPVADVHGTRVRVSPSTGPVVIGLTRPEIIVPRWLLQRAPSEQRVVLAHEAEHVRAGDALVLATASAAVILMPWNPALWIMLSRIRLAIEVDCDARVLHRGVSPRSYGSLLVDVAERASPMPFTAPALADGSSHLHQRILAMQPRRFRHPVLRGASVAILGLAAVLVACEAKMPTSAQIERMDATSTERDMQKLGMLPTDSSVGWLVDGVVTTAASAKAIPAEKIGKIEVGNEQGRTQVYIFTKGGQNRRFTWTRDTLGALHRQVGMLKDTIAVMNKFQAATGGEGKPILFIDGVRSNMEALSKLDHARIDRVEVLKNALATAKYGNDGRNGVIEVTTKK